MSEILTLIKTSSQTLKDAVANPVPPSAGTDLFQRYMISNMQDGSNKDFDAIRAHLLTDSKIFVQRAKEARGDIALNAKNLIHKDGVIMTGGTSRLVWTILNAAADDTGSFSVIFVMSEAQIPHCIRDSLSRLRARNISVVIMPLSNVATILHKVTLTMFGADSITENGGAVSTIGTRNIGLLSNSARKPLYVVAETHKFVRIFPLRGEDINGGHDVLNASHCDSPPKVPGNASGLLDYIPPELIRALITEKGFLSPNAIGEELIKLWY